MDRILKRFSNSPVLGMLLLRFPEISGITRLPSNATHYVFVSKFMAVPLQSDRVDLLKSLPVRSDAIFARVTLRLEVR